MSDRSDSPEPSGWNSEATAKFYAAEAEKRRQEEESQKRLEELKKKNTDMQSLDGGVKMKKKSRRYKRKTHRKSKCI